MCRTRWCFQGVNYSKKEENIMLQKISTDKAPAAIGPYSQGIVLGNIFFASGQIPIDPATGEIHGTTIEEQAEQVMKNIGELLKAAGTDYTRVAKTSCFLADMGDFAAFNQVYAKYFTENPARSCVAVKTLPKNVLCEVEVIAEV
jgi:2-iminobutanoate/2-iminopropanoate deaminase